MAIAAGVNSKGTQGFGSSAVTSAVTTQESGSVIVLAVVVADGTSVTVPADSKGNTYTKVGNDDIFADGNKKLQWYVCENAIGGAGHTATVQVSPDDSVTVLFQEITGAAVAGAVDTAVTAGGNDTSSPFEITSGTLSQPNEILLSMFGGNVGTNAASTETSGMTKTAEEQNGGSFYDLALAYRIVNDTTPYTASWTRDTATDCGLGIIGIKEAATYSREQEGYRWRADDGSETGATWLAAQDSNITRATSLATRLRMLIDASDDPPGTQYQLEYKLAAASTYRKVEAAGGDAITFGSIGSATTSGTTAPSVAYPTGIQAGDILILAIGNRPNTSTPATPSGWTDASDYTQTGGAGSEGAGTGVVRCTVFYKVADGTESGNLSLSIASGTSCAAAMWRVTKTTGKDWAVALANGSDNSAGTSFSVAMGSDPGVTAGDLVYVATVSSEDTASFASQALTQSGVTYGSMSERLDQAVSTGNDLRLVVSEHAVSSGTSVAAATFTATASGTNSGNVAGTSIMIRLRQVDQPIQLAASSNITASGEATTAQLTAPSGKTTDDFDAGRMQDDENPADSVDISSDGYTELEWSLQATALASVEQVYQFRVTANGTALDTYTLIPEWTIGSAEGGAGPLRPQDGIGSGGMQSMTGGMQD